MWQGNENIHPGFMRLDTHSTPNYLAQFRQESWQTTTAKRIRSGLYEYTGPRRAAITTLSNQRVYTFGTREGMGEDYAEHFRVWDDHDKEMRAWESAGRPVDFSYPD